VSGKQKIYDKLISGNASVQNRYFSFVSSHGRLHGVMPAAAGGDPCSAKWSTIERPNTPVAPVIATTRSFTQNKFFIIEYLKK